MSWFRKARQNVSKAAVNADDIRAAPVDPTLESAARETAARIQEKAITIGQLAMDITTMTDDLLSQFKARQDEKPPH